MERVVVIGGVAAGMSAASQLRRMNKEVEIVVFEKGTDVSYSACGMPYYLSGTVSSKEELIARTVNQFEERNIIVHTQYEVKEVNHTKKYILAEHTQTNQVMQMTYDKLVIATGASAIQPPFLPKEASNVFSLKTLEDSENIHQYLKKNRVENVTIIGGGYVGIELVETMRLLGKQVRLIERGDHVLSILDKEMAAYIQEQLKEEAIFHFNENVEGLVEVEGKVNSVQTNQGVYKTDLVIVNVGIKPNTSFVERNGLRMLDNGAIIINDKMETNVPDIYAAGDCATSYHRVLQKNVHIALGTIANKQGRILGYRLGGENRTFPGVLGTSVVKVMDLEIAKTGISGKEAKEANINYKTVTTKAVNHASYYPGSEEIMIKLVYDANTMVILGAQMVGKDGVAKRIDVFATAITAQLTAEQMTMLDLSYAPPFATVWDAVQFATQKVKPSVGLHPH
ncbi:CoA-disulfide reductase [Priestia megaterium]|nr:CoA-disulfide reductase [Priestia megaterium]